MFLFGLLVYWMYRRRLPWSCDSHRPREKENWIIEQQWNADDTFSASFKDFFTKTLNHDPQRRESAAILQDHLEAMDMEGDEASLEPDEGSSDTTSKGGRLFRVKKERPHRSRTILSCKRKISVSLNISVS